MKVTKASVLRALEAWKTAMSRRDLDSVVSCYAKGGVLWGTLAKERKSGRSSIRPYFEQFCAKPCLDVEFKNHLIRIYGDIAIDSGDYIFKWMIDNTKVAVPARFSFTLGIEEGELRILDHHSSLFPGDNFDPGPFFIS
jgi:hypothetical protein